ncbi:Co-chaperone Hsc20, partial [Hysterangium stoloniferum]
FSSFTTCPSCSAQLPTALPTCPKCQYIAPLPQSMSYFHYFGLPDTDSTDPFNIDTRDLRRRFLQTQRICHPDTWAQKGEKELALAAAQSSQLNKAYQTLLSPLDRAQYILSLQGIEESESEKLEDQDLIMQVMEARQDVEDADNVEKLQQLKKVNQDRINETVDEIRTLISRKDWRSTREATIRLKYWLGIDHAAQER